ncbi:hypothetical protein CDEST_07286 [Colletotrichum destructivum]|uniref:Uncharacterized protein n=1 Tax=Colletotrichum destructivum TaxID=34406 RepID=A0AAX4IFU6_9PEZI|nr:hypothetical protein CDEST_07286 [Colletotrichum destructivum]
MLTIRTSSLLFICPSGYCTKRLDSFHGVVAPGSLRRPRCRVRQRGALDNGEAVWLVVSTHITLYIQTVYASSSLLSKSKGCGSWYATLTAGVWERTAYRVVRNSRAVYRRSSWQVAMLRSLMIMIQRRGASEKGAGRAGMPSSFDCSGSNFAT